MPTAIPLASGPVQYAISAPALQQGLIELGLTLVAVLVVGVGGLSYFRRVRLDRPPIGTFNGRDIAFLLLVIIALPFLYAVLPIWALTCFLAVTFAASLSIGYRPLLGGTVTWLGIGVLIGANIWTSHNMLGSVGGWQLWWAELDVLVLLGAIAVANLYVQDGMRLVHVAWFGMALAVYDAASSLVIHVTDKLVQEFLGAPLDPSAGMRFGVNNYAVGIGDLLFYGLFVVAAYKAYGRTAARIALTVTVVFGAAVPSMVPLLINFVDARGDQLVPAQLFYAPAAFVCYLWLRHHYGRERTMAEYWASPDSRLAAEPAAEPVAAPEPASV